MINKPQDLDLIFEALANKHRREIIYVLGLHPHSISQLAQLRDLSLPAIHKHLKILQSANLTLNKKIGRVNFLTLNKETILLLQNWLMQYQVYWGNNQESFENYAVYLANDKSKKGGDVS